MNQSGKKPYDKYAWVLFLPSGILLLAFPLISLLQSYFFDPELKGLNWLTSDPAILGFIRWNFTFQSLFSTGFGVFIMATSLTGYRRHERWAWYAFLYLPLFLLGVQVLAYWLFLITIPLLIMSLLGLALPYRKFFPSK